MATGGCLGDGDLGAEPSAVGIPLPQNSTYTYEAEEGGATLTVELSEDRSTRLGPGLSPHEVWGVSIAYHSGDEEDEVFRFEEAVDVSTGMLVQQVAWCGVRVRDPGGDFCYDDRAMVITASGGLPGGLGAGPFWGTRVGPGPVQVTLAEILSGDGSLVYEARAAAASVGVERATKCVEMGVAERPVPVRALGFTGGLGPFVLCEDLGLPKAFTVLSGERFQGTRFVLVDRRGPSPGWEQPPQERPVPGWGDGLPKREIGPPWVVEHPHVETNLSVREADQVASDRSQAYASVMEEGGWVVGTHLAQTGRGGGPTQDSSTFERSLTAVSPVGDFVRVSIEKEQRSTVLGHEETSYELTDEQRGRWEGRTPQRQGYTVTQLDVEDALQFAEEATGLPRDDLGFGLWASIPPNHWQGADRPMRADGYTFVSWHEDPNPQMRNGLLISRPYQAVLDGPTGNLLWLTVQQDDLPLTEHLSFQGVDSRAHSP